MQRYSTADIPPAQRFDAWAGLGWLLDPHNGERIGALAERWGFSDAAHLSRLFRATYGMTPRDYRAIAGRHED